jgi:DNA-binding transcriptional LysR family regulator
MPLGKPARRRPQSEPEAELPVVLYEAGGHARRVIDDWFIAAGLVPKPVMELGSVEAIRELVAAGLGCAMLPRLAVTGIGSRDDIVVRPRRIVIPRRRLSRGASGARLRVKTRSGIIAANG